jgi:outer membrane immunogenic protein
LGKTGVGGRRDVALGEFMNFRSLALGAAVLLSLSPVAGATDWDGYYFGAVASQGSSEADTARAITGTGYAAFDAAGITAVQNASAMTLENDTFGGGGLFGVNFPLGEWLIGGLEIDASGFNNETSKSATVTYPCCAPATFTTGNKVEQSWVGTARLRLGLANDFAMIYATGGYAGGEVTLTQTFSDTSGPIALQTINNSEFLSGYSIGGGIELMIESGVNLRAEYLHMDLGEIEAIGSIAVATRTSTGRAEISDQFVRVGINFSID